ARRVPWPSARGLVPLLLLAGAAALVVIGRVLPRPASPAAEPAPVVSVSAGGRAPAAGPSGPVVVHVVGAVRHPGVYRLPAGSRARDAVRHAGGVRRHAAPGSVTLAALLADGEQVRVPRLAQPGSVGAGPGTSAPPAIVHLN